MKASIQTILALGIGVLCAAPAARAQEISGEQEVPRLTTTFQKLSPRPEPEAAVTIGWEGEVGVKHIDNIYRAPNNEKSDEVAVIAPGFVVRSHLDKHSYAVKGNLEHGEYFSKSENDYTDGGLKARGRYDISDNLHVLGNAAYRYDHVDIGSLEDDPDRQLSEPTVYQAGKIALGVSKDNQIIRFEPEVTWLTYDYDNTDRRDGTVAINDDRDRDEYYASALFGYYLNPETVPYVKGVANTREYDKRIDNTAASALDSDGYTALIGVQWGNRSALDRFEDWGEKGTRWVDANIGYLQQDYDSSARPDIHRLAFNADARWQMRDDFLLKGLISRSVEETTLTGVSGYLRTRIGGEAEYLLTPDWLLGAGLRYSLHGFSVDESVRADREDDLYEGNLLVQYNLTEHYNVGVEYQYADRNSDDNSFDFNQNILLARLKAEY